MMNAPAENPPHEIDRSKNINVLSLDKNIAHLTSGYLTDKDLVNLCVSSKGLYRIFYPSLEKRLMPLLLKYVVEGRLDKVEEILNRNKKLVFLPGDITDLSGRVFPRITAFQYATWALDKEMWELILKYLPEKDAYNQLMEVEEGRSEFIKLHGKYLNFEPLLEAYQKYIDNFDGGYSARKRDQIEACWCKEVGGAQRQMPAWFVYVFCEEGGDKAWSTNDFKKPFRRDPTHLSWWFEGEEYEGKLGVKWAAARSSWGVGACSGTRLTAADGGVADRQHLHACQEERMSCRDLLKDYLKSVAERKNLAPKSNNF